MALLLEQIKQLVKERPRKKELELGRWHQNKLKFHTETKILKTELSPYYQEFLGWVSSNNPEFLPKDKIDRFKQLMLCPLPTIQLTQSIIICLSRVFEGQDSFFRYDFEDDKNESDWEKFRDCEFWEQEGAKVMTNAIDSVWVVDLPSVQTTEKPEPKNMVIDISSVVDISVNPDGTCKYVIFEIGDKLFVYDEISIRSFDYVIPQSSLPQSTDPNIITNMGFGREIGSILSELKHDLGYCPARMFWSEPLSSSNTINRKAPLTNVLGELDWLLVHKVFKRYMDIANSFPILVTYENNDNYEDLKRENDKAKNPNQPIGKRFIGPGAIMEVPHPLEGQPDLMNNPVKWITPDISSLQFHVTEDERLTDYIFKTSVGIDGEQKNDQAKNEKQVAASFENQTMILNRLAENFEKIQTFAEETIIKLRYGVESINDVSIDYGTKFFLRTITDLVAEKDAVTGDDIILDAISEELIETKFRNDTSGKTRAEVIRDLDPLPGIVGMNRAGDSPIDEAIKIYQAGGIDLNAFIIKCNLMSFVRRFEREQLSIAQFIRKGDYNERIGIIKDEFIKYAQEYQEQEKAPIATVPAIPVATAMSVPVTTTDMTMMNNKQMNPAKKGAGKIIINK